MLGRNVWHCIEEAEGSVFQGQKNRLERKTAVFQPYGKRLLWWYWSKTTFQKCLKDVSQRKLQRSAVMRRPQPLPQTGKKWVTKSVWIQAKVRKQEPQNPSVVSGKDFHPMVSSGLSQVSKSLTHSGEGIMWLEPAAGAIPEAQWFLCFSAEEPVWLTVLSSTVRVPAGFVNGYFLSEKGAGHFQTKEGIL